MDPQDGDVLTLWAGNGPEPGPYSTEVQVAPLDAIVIRRDELPEVVAETWDDGRVMLHAVTEPDLVWRPTQQQAVQTRRYAYAELAVADAIARHLRGHPPVDERAVDELQDLLIEMGSGHARHIAHALIATGRVKVEP